MEVRASAYEGVGRQGVWDANQSKEATDINFPSFSIWDTDQTLNSAALSMSSSDFKHAADCLHGGKGPAKL